MWYPEPVSFYRSLKNHYIPCVQKKVPTGINCDNDEIEKSIMMETDLIEKLTRKKVIISKCTGMYWDFNYWLTWACLDSLSTCQVISLYSHNLKCWLHKKFASSVMMVAITLHVYKNDAHERLNPRETLLNHRYSYSVYF